MTHPHRHLTCGLALTVIGAAAVVASAQQKPVFRSDIGMVPVYATVTDNQGGFVLDLKKEDFEIRDEGKPQEIEYFTTDTQPLSVLILIDGSTSVTPSYDTVIEAASSFILRMLPTDRAAIASFADRFQMRQPFTSDRDALLKHLVDPFSIRMGLETRLWDALHESAMSFGKEEGRRIIFAITDGYNWVAPSTTGPFSTSGRENGSPSTVATNADSRDVMIYAAALWTQYEGRAEAPSRRIIDLALRTGGSYIEITPGLNMNATFTAVLDELHKQYVLGFMPKVLDGKQHRLDVRVKRPSVQVRARRSYQAPKR
jgi:Ca-activated chloride channel family protein